MKAVQTLLWPFSVLYEGIVRVRAACYRAGVRRQKKLDGVVISVGNLTVGGTGKTPMVLHLVERLAGEGKRVAILTRGYRGRDGSSDEANLLRSRLGDAVKVGVGVDRYLAGRKLAREGVDCFVLDDGFQHLRLARDENLVLIDATDPFGGGHLLPAGRLREPKAALARADVIVITRSSHAPAVEAIAMRFSTAPIFYAQTELAGIFCLPDRASVLSPFDAREKKFYAFCAIGNPSAFFEDLHRWGIEIAGHSFFRDHHRYTPVEVEEMERHALAAGADALLCTEKDLFNLPGARISRLPVAFCRISLLISEEEKFWQVIHSAVARGREKPAQ